MRLKILHVLPPWTKCSVTKYGEADIIGSGEAEIAVENSFAVFSNTILSRWEHDWIIEQVEKLHDEYVYAKSNSEDYENVRNKSSNKKV